jgi:hypothetical protein
LAASFYIGLAIVTALNGLLALGVFTTVRSRLPYWLA